MNKLSIRPLFVLFLMLGLAGCTAPVMVKVAGYKAIDAQEIQGKAIYVQERSNVPNPILEKEIGMKLKKGLRDLGYKVVDTGIEADSILSFDYGIDSGKVETVTSSSSGTKTQLNIYTGQLENIGTTDVSSHNYTVYTRTLILKLVSAKNPKSVTWIGEVKSPGTSSDLRYILTFLIEGGMLHFNENTEKEVTHKFRPEEEASKEKNVSDDGSS